MTPDFSWQTFDAADNDNDFWIDVDPRPVMQFPATD